MPHVPLHLAVDDPDVVDGLALIREQQHVPGPHPAEAVAVAEDAATRVLGSLDGGGRGPSRRDARDLAFVTIDPEGSRDLDQALHIERRPGSGAGWRVHYAIADVGAFVTAGSPLDAACWDRGLTFYLPDADLVEALVLRPLVGRDLDVAVVSADDDGSTVVCRDPAVEARIPDRRLPLGEQITVRVAAADPATRRITLMPR